MADAGTIKSFFYQLGFTVDQSQARKFTDSISAADKQIEALQDALNAAAKALQQVSAAFGQAGGEPARKYEETSRRIQNRQEQINKAFKDFGSFILGTATAFAGSVERVAREYERLFYVAQRTGAQVQTLGGLGFGAKQIGLDAEAITQIISNLSNKMVEMPGILQAIQAASGGGDLSALLDRTKGIKEQQEAWLSFIERISSLRNDPRLSVLADMLGTTVESLQRWIDNAPAARQAINEYNQMITRTGINQTEFANQSTKFVRDLNTLWTNFFGLMQQSAAGAMPALDALTKWATGFVTQLQEFNKHHPGAALAEGVAEAAAAYAGLAVVLGLVTGRYLGLGAAARAVAAALKAIPGAALVFGAVEGAGRLRGDVERTHERTGRGWFESFLRTLLLPKWVTDPGAYHHRHGDANIPHMQGGGVMRREGLAYLHAGENVLPNSAVGILQALYEGFQSWWLGSSNFRPYVVVREDPRLQPGGVRPDQMLPGVGRAHGQFGIGAPGRPGMGLPGPDRGTHTPSGADLGMAAQLYSFATKTLGLDREHTLAMLANAFAESGFSTTRVGSHGERGLFQWDATRWAQLQHVLGRHSGNIFAQFMYAMQEQRNRYPAWFRHHGRGALTAEWEHTFERPAVETGRFSWLRGLERAGIGGHHRHGEPITVNQTNNVTINAPSGGDGQQIARFHQRAASDAFRNARGRFGTY